MDSTIMGTTVYKLVDGQIFLRASAIVIPARDPYSSNQISTLSIFNA